MSKVKKQRQQQQRPGSSSEVGKKNQAKLQLQEQYNKIKRKNRDLKDKHQDTEKCVQEFINEMGSMIDVAE